jgi:hypothetical protein
MYIGTVLKILHGGQKHYAVVATYAGKDVTVRTVTFSPNSNGSPIVLEKTLPISETRTVSEPQGSPMFVLLRQMVGVAHETPKPAAPAKALGGHKDDLD